MADRSARMWIVAPVAAFVGVLVFTQAFGLSARRTLPEQRVHTVATAAEGYAALRSDGVAGRVVVLLDERTRMVPRTWMATFMDSLAASATQPPVMLYNSMSDLVYAGVARSVYFVPPGAAYFDRELKRFTSRPDSLSEGNGERLRFNAVPVVLTQESELPVFGEKVIVWIYDPTLEGYSRDFVNHVTDPAIADVVVRVKGP